jgi:hypothetical protein
MTLEMLRKFFAWCSVINLGVLAVWFLGYWVARDWIQQIHGTWFRLKPETFDALHYGGMGLFKGCVLILNLVPYLVLRIWF